MEILRTNKKNEKGISIIGEKSNSYGSRISNNESVMVSDTYANVLEKLIDKYGIPFVKKHAKSIAILVGTSLIGGSSLAVVNSIKDERELKNISLEQMIEFDIEHGGALQFGNNVFELEHRRNIVKMIDNTDDIDSIFIGFSGKDRKEYSLDEVKTLVDSGYLTVEDKIKLSKLGDKDIIDMIEEYNKCLSSISIDNFKKCIQLRSELDYIRDYNLTLLKKKGPEIINSAILKGIKDEHEKVYGVVGDRVDASDENTIIISYDEKDSSVIRCRDVAGVYSEAVEYLKRYIQGENLSNLDDDGICELVDEGLLNIKKIEISEPCDIMILDDFYGKNMVGSWLDGYNEEVSSKSLKK